MTDFELACRIVNNIKVQHPEKSFNYYFDNYIYLSDFRCFDWIKTSEGSDFWLEVCQRKVATYQDLRKYLRLYIEYSSSKVTFINLYFFI